MTHQVSHDDGVVEIKEVTLGPVAAPLHKLRPVGEDKAVALLHRLGVEVLLGEAAAPRILHVRSNDLLLDAALERLGLAELGVVPGHLQVQHRHRVHELEVECVLISRQRIVRGLLYTASGDKDGTCECKCMIPLTRLTSQAPSPRSS
jgi:hypothetical protein